MGESAIPLSQVLDVLSREAGCPLFVASPEGVPLATPREHPVPCLEASGQSGGCPGARVFAKKFANRAGVGTCPREARPHLVVPLVEHGAPQALVIAELWVAGNAPAVRVRARRMARLAAALLQKALPSQAPEVTGPVEAVPSPVIRWALADARLTQEGLRRLRTRYRLSWREVEVLVLYYLTTHGPGIRVRASVGRILGLTEGSVREYVRRLRRKLGVRFRRSPEVWVWAREEGLIREGR